LVLRWFSRRFAWLMPWYYLLPSIVFLLTFTFFPVLLTVGLAFTDYAGIRNGELNPTTEVPVVAVDGAALTVADPARLDCADLRNGCNGVRAVVYASGEVRAEAVAIEGAVLTLAEAPPEGRIVETVALNLPDIGFELEVRVVAQEGNQLTLQRAPPSAPELGTVRLSLDRTPVQVRIVEERGDLMVLDAPLPEGLEAEIIAAEIYLRFVR